MRDDNERPDGTTLLPWARGKPMAWDVTVPETYAESHIGNTATKPGAASDREHVFFVFFRFQKNMTLRFLK